MIIPTVVQAQALHSALNNQVFSIRQCVHRLHEVIEISHLAFGLWHE